jgi:hypothetical protein
MDDRQTQIRQGAGLEESRINTDFIDFLNKWSSPVLIGLGLIGLGWAGLRYLDRKKTEKIDNGFSAYSDTVSGANPSEASLRNIAENYEGVRSVPELARLDAIDIYLRAAIAGVEPGAEVDPVNGLPRTADDRLDEERTIGYLQRARDLSQQVIAATKDDEGKRLLTIHAMMRLAAAHEGLGAGAEAKSTYTSIVTMAKASGFPELATLAETRGNAVDTLAAGVVLPSQGALAPLPGEQPTNIGEIMSTPSIESGDPNADTGTTEGGQSPAEVPAQPETATDPAPAAEPATGGDPAP